MYLDFSVHSPCSSIDLLTAGQNFAEEDRKIMCQYWVFKVISSTTSCLYSQSRNKFIKHFYGPQLVKSSLLYPACHRHSCCRPLSLSLVPSSLCHLVKIPSTWQHRVIKGYVWTGDKRVLVDMILTVDNRKVQFMSFPLSTKLILPQFFSFLIPDTWEG